jgi:hypothetical protein
VDASAPDYYYSYRYYPYSYGYGPQEAGEHPEWQTEGSDAGETAGESVSHGRDDDSQAL